jgi:putative ABC transport system ATP-binding protein
MMGLCKLGKHAVERALVLFSPIRRREHSEKQHLGAGGLDFSDHLIEIVAYGRRIDAAQRVIGAERQDDQVRLIGECPVKPGQAARCSVAGNSSIEDPGRDAALVEPSFKSCRKGLGYRQPQPGGKAVAEIEYYRDARHGRCGDGNQRQRDGGDKTPGGAAPLQLRKEGVASHCVESTGDRAISSGDLVPGAAGRMLPAARHFWFGRSMTTSLHPGGPLVLLDDVHLTLGSAAGPVNILRGISLGVEAGETVSIVGPSGSGKSTLLMVLGGLERPSSGLVRVDGIDLGGLDEDALARLRRARIGIVFQSFHLLPTMTALENVAIPLELGGRRDAFAAAAEALATVGLGHRLTHYPGQLSGGEQQRVAIARAFIAGPKVLLADEPTGNLDGATGRLIVDCLFEQHARHGTTLLLITHDRAIAERCERQVRLMDGRIVEDRQITRGRFAAIGHAR